MGEERQASFFLMSTSKREGGGRTKIEASLYFFSETEKRSAANVVKLISG